MVEPIAGEDALRHVEENASKLESLSRKEKRKAAKKLKRREVRKEVALNERAEKEARLNDPEEQLRIRLKEQEEEEILEKERKAFEEREKLWIEAAKKAEEESQKRKLLEEEEELQRKQFEDKNDLNEDDAWEYVEEGPAEIIWHGDEITVKKKRVRVAKKNVGQQSQKEDMDRPTSNPLPPQSEAFADYKSSSMPSTHQVFESVAQQVPNFGTEQDKAHCPFHIKTGACRFGSRCSRVHFYPDKSCTLLIKNMYNGPGLAWEQDEGLEYTDEEIESCYEEFYEDVHTEFLKFGEIVNFKVCKNGSSHLRGNVYVHYKSLESAILAYHSINGRYFAGKQITCEFVGITRWKVAICGEYIKSKLKTCSRGMACNFIHCFCNPGGDYEWADSDNPPPRYWVKKMAALFGSRDESSRFDQETEREIQGHSKNSRKKLKAKCHSGRSISSEMESFNAYTGGDNDGENTRWSSCSSRHAHYYVESIHDHHNDSGRDNFDRNRCIGPYRSHTRTSSSRLKTEKEFPDHHMKHAKYNPSDCERYEPLNRSQSEDSDAKYSELLRVRDHRGHSRRERSSVAKPILHHESRESDVNYEVDDPVCPDKRHKSQNDDPEHYYRENVDEWHRWEPGSSSSDKCPKSRRYSSENREQYIGTTKSHDQSLGVHHRKSRSSSQSSFGTDSNGTDKATDSSDGYQEFKENHELCHAIQLQHESNSKKNKFQKRQARDGSLSCREFKGKSDCELEDSKLISYDAKAQTSCHIALEEYEDRIVSSEGHKCSQKHETTGKREGYKRKKGKYEKSTEVENEVSTVAPNNVNGNGASKKRSRSQSCLQRLGRSRRERSQLDES